VKALEIERELS